MKSKITSLIKNNKYVLLSGLAAFFIITIVYFCYSIIPFGDKIIYRMDLYHQYGPLFSELYDRLTSGESLLYSWNSGLGSSFIGNFFNYLSSPFSILVLIFGHDNTFEAVAAMIAIKSILSSMSLSYYLKKSHNDDGPQLIAFGVMYVFSAYFIAYYWNVMWIDSLYLLPLIALGIENIINKGKCSVYIIFLSLAIFTNYYIGFMLCIFSCIYFLYYFFCSYNSINKKQIKINSESSVQGYLKNSFLIQSGIRFAFSSLAVGIILLFMLVPVAYVLSSSSATSGNNPSEIKLYFDIFDFLANHLASLEPTIRSSGEDVLPNVYCGILTLVLIPMYIFSDKIRSIEKIASVIFLSIFYLSFNVNIINFLWHGLHFPNDLPYRQSFMYSFILITLAYKAFMNISELNKKQLISIGTGIIAFIILVQKIESKNVINTSVFISIGFVIAYVIILGLINSKKCQAISISIILSCTVISESILASTTHYVANQHKSSFVEDYDAYKEIQEVVDKKDESLFYRSELSDLRTRMDPCWYDYNGVSVFSSMAYESVARLQKEIGLFGNYINSYTYNPQTPIYNSIFSLKYIYDRHNLISEGEYYNLIDLNSTYSVYENNYHLNIAFPVDESVIEWNTANYSNPVYAQEFLFQLTTGIDNIYNEIYDYDFEYNNVYEISEDSKYSNSFTIFKNNEDDEASLIINLISNSNGHIYVYLNSRNLDSVDVTSPIINTTMEVKDGYILDLGYYGSNDLIRLELPVKDDTTFANVDFIAFTIDNDKFIEGYNKLKSGQLEYKKFNDTEIEGTFIAEENELLFTSIPYDKGWNVYVDGEKVSDKNIIKISDSLLGVKVEEGEHTISFKYAIPGLNIATIISLVFISLIFVLYIMKKKRVLIFKNLKQNIWDVANIESNNIKSSETEKILESEESDLIHENAKDITIVDNNINTDEIE